MTEHIIKAALEADFSEHDIFGIEGPKFAAFYAIAYRAGMERAAEIAETCGGTVSMFATSKDARTHNNAVTLCANSIRAHAQNQPKNVHDGSVV